MPSTIVSKVRWTSLQTTTPKANKSLYNGMPEKHDITRNQIFPQPTPLTSHHPPHGELLEAACQTGKYVQLVYDSMMQSVSTQRSPALSGGGW